MFFIQFNNIIGNSFDIVRRQNMFDGCIDDQFFKFFFADSLSLAAFFLLFAVAADIVIVCFFIFAGAAFATVRAAAFFAEHFAC
ncbi:hypothetical protein Q5O14_07700 [Eubacteriaceae bacterium ES2]|nr:hypothetical protein Q5O14_07700 [Eubacteriaceae bacterium ES2]